MKTRVLQVPALVVFCVGSLLTCDGAGAAVDLALKLQTGQVYYQKSTIDQQIDQTVMGQQQSVTQVIGTGLKMDVLAVDARGDMRIRYTYIWARLKQNAAMMSIDYDSAKEGPVPSGAQGFAALLGQSYIITLTPKGKAVKVEGAQELREQVLKKLPSGVEGTQMMAVLNPFLDEDGLRETTESGTAVYPDGAVAPGDSWTHKVTRSVGFAMIIESTSTVEKLEGGVVVIKVKASVQSDPEAPPMDAGAMKMRSRLSGTHEGVMHMKESTGLVTRNTALSLLQGEIELVTEADGPPMMSIPITVKTEATVEVGDQMWKAEPE